MQVMRGFVVFTFFRLTGDIDKKQVHASYFRYSGTSVFIGQFTFKKNVPTYTFKDP